MKNEALNLAKCLASLSRVSRVIVVDSQSTDGSIPIAESHHAEVVQFSYKGGYPKKRQWALNTLSIDTPWVFLLDADEVVPDLLWDEIDAKINSPNPSVGFLIYKGLHFLGRRFRFGGFSHSAVLLFQNGRARFERLNVSAASGLDMEVHERLIADGHIAQLRTPLVHQDFKGLAAYLDRHNRYSTWEAEVRQRFLRTRRWGEDSIRASLFGNAQERRRFLKHIAVRVPFEPILWFIYHYFVKLGVLEGRPGLIASWIRCDYIAQVRAKVFELQQHDMSRT